MSLKLHCWSDDHRVAEKATQRDLVVSAASVLAFVLDVSLRWMFSIDDISVEVVVKLTRVSSLLQKHSAADITSSLSEDQVPGPFLVMVLIQFGSMVVDRALYLRKTVMGKVIFQVILVFGIHFWMFFILPGVTDK